MRPSTVADLLGHLVGASVFNTVDADGIAIVTRETSDYIPRSDGQLGHSVELANGNAVLIADNLNPIAGANVRAHGFVALREVWEASPPARPALAARSRDWEKLRLSLGTERPPLAAIKRCFAGSIAAKPRGLGVVKGWPPKGG
jgi:hypothetical protein